MNAASSLEPALNIPASASSAAVPRNAITAITPGSAAEAAGLRVGDLLLKLDEHAPRDIIDIRLYGTEEELTVTVERDGRALTVPISKDEDEDLGLEVAEPTFDGLRTCNNNCPFCFLKGVPPGLRSSLYVKDDDYRYSFLYGSYVTLTNLAPADWERIAEQRLAPLFVSVHATDPELRGRLLGHRRARPILPHIAWFAEHGLSLHAQVVVWPGVNDGDQLERTIAELGERHPTVESIAVVPVGLSAYNPAPPRWESAPLRAPTPSEGAAVLARVAAWQRRFQREHGTRLVYAADEWFFLTRRALPGKAYYEDCPQLYNGVGGARRFLDAWKLARRRLPRSLACPCQLTMVCATLTQPVLEPVVADLAMIPGLRATLLPVHNAFFGGGVSVSGLLTPPDILTALATAPRPDLLVLPRAALDLSGERFLDGTMWTSFIERAGCAAALAATPRDVADIVRGLEGERTVA